MSWETILNKRENYRKAFDHFDARKIARYDERKVRELVGECRNRAQPAENRRRRFPMRSRFCRSKKNSAPSTVISGNSSAASRKNHWHSTDRLPARTAESDAMSKDLKKRGFRFVGTTICYAFMQATGMVNDHAADCFAR